ncbi:MAG TPA: response regulator [Bryobacteraceae bacterium]
MDWPSVSESWIVTTGGSGSNPNPDEDQSSALRSPSDQQSASVPRHLLIVEDNEADVFLIQQAIEAVKLPVTIHVVSDGNQAVQFFDRADADASVPCPALVLLDINLPKKHGGDVLKYLRQSRRCAKALVLVVSTSDSTQDREQMKSLGADGYFRKPSEYDAFMKLGEMVKLLLTEG